MPPPYARQQSLHQVAERRELDVSTKALLSYPNENYKCQFCSILFVNEELFRVHQVSGCLAVGSYSPKAADNRHNGSECTAVTLGCDNNELVIREIEPEVKCIPTVEPSEDQTVCDHLNNVSPQNLLEQLNQSLDGILDSNVHQDDTSAIAMLVNEFKSFKDTTADIINSLNNSLEICINKINELTKSVVYIQQPIDTKQCQCTGEQKWTNVPYKRGTVSSATSQLVSTNSTNVIPTSNRFQSLTCPNNSPPEINYDDDKFGYEKGISPTNTSQNNVRRPHVVVDNFPEQQQIKLVPGKKPYNRAHVSNIAVVTDSMTNRIKARDFNRKLGEEEKAIFSKFHGATAKAICHYAEYTIEEDSPKSIIILAGTNDISYAYGVGMEPDPYTISEHVMDIGRKAKRKGVESVYVSGIIRRRGRRYERIRKDINCMLERKCNEEGSCYVNHDNISLENLSFDGLHLNHMGTERLMQNLLKCCKSTPYWEQFNPYLYENEGIL